jgi:hypothetical protein
MEGFIGMYGIQVKVGRRHADGAGENQKKGGGKRWAACRIGVSAAR